MGRASTLSQLSSSIMGRRDFLLVTGVVLYTCLMFETRIVSVVSYSLTMHSIHHCEALSRILIILGHFMLPSQGINRKCARAIIYAQLKPEGVEYLLNIDLNKDLTNVNILCDGHGAREMFQVAYAYFVFVECNGLHVSYLE